MHGPTAARATRSLLVMTGLGLSALVAVGALPAEQAARAAAGSVDAVVPTVESDPVPHGGDAADDPAIWVNSADPALSAVVAADKKGGLAVYDLSGRQLQFLPVGDVNNVDLRAHTGPGTGFVLSGRPVSLVVAGNRSTNGLGVYVLDAGTRQLRDVAARPLRAGVEVYGSCLYRSAATGRHFVFVSSKSGQVEQWELFDGGGRVDARLVRSLDVGGQVEGCVADDQLGHLYVGEESVGIWKYGAEPGAGTAGTLVAAASPSGPLVPDVEGLTIAYGPGGTGHLIASSQGDSSFAVYTREGDNRFVRSFTVVAGNGVDGVEDTDGLDVSTADLGPAFPRGALIVQDGANSGGNQNFKFVPYEAVFH